MTRAKICGITNSEDALVAVNAGADALGFVFYEPSPRYVTPSDARKIVDALPPFVTSVALFVNADENRVREVIKIVQPDLLQFHGEEEPGFCDQFERPYIKAIGVTEQTDLQAECEKYSRARAVLLDTHDPKLKGGTGRVFNWEWARQDLSAPVVLAGGLNPENVRKAIDFVRPFAVDVSGGVEKSKGMKDPLLVKAFLSEVHSERKT